MCKKSILIISVIISLYGCSDTDEIYISGERKRRPIDKAPTQIRDLTNLLEYSGQLIVLDGKLTSIRGVHAYLTLDCGAVLHIPNFDRFCRGEDWLEMYDDKYILIEGKILSLFSENIENLPGPYLVNIENIQAK